MYSCKGVLFDFTNNKKIKDTGFAIEGKEVAGYVQGNSIAINIDSSKALNTVVGHEITHILEGTELYPALQDAVKVFAESKGEYNSKLQSITEMYDGIEDANIENELTAELVGEYLFSDTEFIKNLSAEQPGVFKKVYEEIKYLCKVATTGSKELRQLEKVKKTFAEVYRQKNNTVTDNGVKYSSMTEHIDDSIWKNVDYNDDATKAEIMRETHQSMINAGVVIEIAEEVKETVAKSYPDLRAMKKKDRTPILKEAMNKLKSNLRAFLNEFKNQGFEFEVNGKVLEAKLYNTGINEVLEKITQDKAEMLYSTKEIFRNARYLYSTSDYDGKSNVYRWNYFYTPVKIGENTVGVRIAVRDVAEGTKNHLPESQIYNWGIKKDTSLDGESHGPKVASSDVSSDVSTNIIRNDNQNVKENDTKLSLADGSTDIAPEMNNNIYGEDVKLQSSDNDLVIDDNVPIKVTASAETVDNNTIEVPDITVDDMEFTVLDDTNISAESTDNSNEKSNDFFDEKAVTRLSSKVIIIDYIKPIPTTEFQALQVTLL